ncbi:MAG: ISAzo13 family transposase [Deltaproteobacteria bacterium]|jgi:hypothetical protein|nr:ISAzo13 family transposase [Deltaproteobacteria bacterium]
MYEMLEKKIQQIMPLLDEKQLRRYLGSEAEALGHGGIAIVSGISGKARNTIAAGIRDNRSGENIGDRTRKAGGGRKSIREKHPEIPKMIECVVSDSTCGNPENPLTYTTKSTRKIKQILNGKGYEIGHNVVGDILEEQGYSLQLNQKMLQIGDEHPDRNTQFEFINDKAKRFLLAGIPVISVDAKKKENLGSFINNGRTYRKSKDPIKVLDHDFPIKELGKVTPFGVYDISRNEGFVNLGISKDTAEFAVESISRCVADIGEKRIP